MPGDISLGDLLKLTAHSFEDITCPAHYNIFYPAKLSTLDDIKSANCYFASNTDVLVEGPRLVSYLHIPTSNKKNHLDHFP